MSTQTDSIALKFVEGVQDHLVPLGWNVRHDMEPAFPGEAVPSVVRLVTSFKIDCPGCPRHGQRVIQSSDHSLINLLTHQDRLPAYIYGVAMNALAALVRDIVGATPPDPQTTWVQE